MDYTIDLLPETIGLIEAVEDAMYDFLYDGRDRFGMNCPAINHSKYNSSTHPYYYYGTALSNNETRIRLGKDFGTWTPLDQEDVPTAALGFVLTTLRNEIGPNK